MNHVDWMEAAVQRNSPWHIAGEEEKGTHRPRSNITVPGLIISKAGAGKVQKSWLQECLQKTALPIPSAMRPVKSAWKGWSWSCLKLSKDLMPPAHTHKTSPLYKSNTETHIGASTQCQEALGWTDIAKTDSRKLSTRGTVLPLPTVLFWDQFNHLIIGFLETAFFSLDISFWF